MNARLAYLIAVLAAALATFFLAGEPDALREDLGSGFPGIFQAVR